MRIVCEVRFILGNGFVSSITGRGTVATGRVDEERVPLYEKYADITIDEEGKDLDESLRAILEIIHIKEQGK